MKKMIHWQRMWDDEENTGCYSPLRIIASLLSYVYLLAVNIRNWLYDQKILEEVKLSCPVISVGNITVGGTGKTPCVIMLAQLLQRNGYKPAVISRGYGGRSVQPVNIVADSNKILLDSEVAGDEPSLIARALQNVPVITGGERRVTGKVAIDKFGADVLICDDAMQHRQIFRDINLVLFDSRDLKIRKNVLPRGKLREPMTQLKRADAILLTRVDEAEPAEQAIAELVQDKNIPVFRSIHQPQDIIRGDFSEKIAMSSLAEKKICAFCGIAKPDSFKRILLAARATILALDIFPDHHRFSANELEKIKDGFIKSGADYLVTTEKDAMRLHNLSEFLKELFILRIEMKIQPSVHALENFILERLKHRAK
ncbi:MAG: tetraacyldisaccharide 4'-kinase [Smithella sp.]